MADNFKGLGNESLKNAIDIQNTMRDIEIATSSLDKKLQKQRQYLIDINEEYKSIKNGASNVSKLQEEIVKSTKGTELATKAQKEQLDNVKKLNIQINNLTEASKKSTGIIKTNLENQAKQLSSARDKAQDLANIYGDIADDAAKLDKSTVL